MEPIPESDADPIAAARALIAQEAEARCQRCQADINVALREHGCHLEARPTPGPLPGLWAFAVVVTSNQEP
jgi:hypothetical protein